MQRFILTVTIILSIGGNADAHPFFRFNARTARRCHPVSAATVVTHLCHCQAGETIGNEDNSPTSLTLPSESKVELQAAPAQSLPSIKTEPPTAQQPGIVGEPRPGVGPPSLIGRLLEGKDIKIEAPDLSKIDLSKLNLSGVNISVPIPQKISESIESVASKVSWFLTFGIAAVGVYLGGKVSQLVVRAGVGLQKLSSGLSVLADIKNSGATNKLPVGTQAEAATTTKPAT